MNTNPTTIPGDAGSIADDNSALGVDHARGLGIGGVDYVTKPFDPLGLAGVIRELVARVASGESLELRRTKLAELRSLVEGA